MVIDVHTHIIRGKYEQDKAGLLRAMEFYEIDRCYVSALDLRSFYPDIDEISEMNNEVARFIREEPRRIGGAVYVNPNNYNTLDVIARGIEEQGMELIKLWCASFCDAPEVNSVAEAAIHYGAPLLIHTFYKSVGQLENESTGINVANLAKRYPECRIIMAHLGGNAYHGIPAIKDCPNVFTDCSGSIYRGDELDYAVEMLGADRILFGSDIMCSSYLVDLGQVLEASLTEEEREKILYKNVQILLNKKVKAI